MLDSTRTARRHWWQSRAWEFLVLSVLSSWPIAAAAAPFAYVSNDGDHTVSVIDTASNTVTATVAADATGGLAVNAAGTRVYAAGGDAVAVIDTASNAVTTTITVDAASMPVLGGVAVSPEGKRIYTAGVAGTAPDTTLHLYAIDGVTNAVQSSATLGPATAVTGVALNPAATQLYVAAQPAGVQVVSPQTLGVLTSIAVQDPTGMAVSPSGARLYVAQQPGGVSTFDTFNDTQIGSIMIGSPGLALNSAGTQLYVDYNNMVLVQSTAAGNFIFSVTVGNMPAGMAVDQTGTRLYVANSGSDSVSVIDTTSTPKPTVTTTVGVGHAPRSVVVGPLGHCGNGVVDPGEECDDGGTCVGGSNAGTACTADADCTGLGACQPFGGDGCAANCTRETDVQVPLVDGFVEGDTVLGGTSGAVLSAQAQTLPLPLPLTGTLTLTVGKQRDGEIPVVVRAASVQLPAIAVGTDVCGCVRAVALKTCGGVPYEADGVTPAPDCTQSASVCAGKDPCTAVFGDGNSASGIVRCDGLDGANVTTTQDAGAAGAALVHLSGVGPAGAARLLDSLAVGAVPGTCDAVSTLCNSADDPAAPGTAVTTPLVTGMASAMVLNADGGSTSVGSSVVSGAPFSCAALAGGSPMGAALVGAFTALAQPSLGDVAVTSIFAAPGAPQPTPTATPSPTSPATDTPTPSIAVSSPTLTPTASSTPTAHACTGDCSNSGMVTVNDLLKMVNIALGSADVSACPAGDANHDQRITINEILAAVNNALNGCP